MGGIERWLAQRRAVPRSNAQKGRMLAVGEMDFRKHYPLSPSVSEAPGVRVGKPRRARSSAAQPTLE